MSTSAGQGMPQRGSRVLACVLCQHRKIKCDRNSPCSNCIKANVTCVPSTPAPARKRRRPNQDLQERLARCEELLKQYADGPAPAPQSTQSPVTPSTSDSVRSATVDTTPPVGEKAANFKPACRMVNDDGSVRFMDSYIWATVYEELQAMRDIVETDEPEDSSILSSEELSPENNTDLFFPGDLSVANVEDLQPDPVHAFKLWQLFLERVNPMFKIIHVPTVQPIVMDGAANILSVPHHQQALLFSIYTTAALSLSETESIQLLGISRESAIQKFLAGTKVALIRFNFLKNYNMTALQAMVHFIHALQGRFDRHALWVLTGTVVRIAQKMGYHRDGELLGLDSYETEMRRRLWWQIIMQDSKFAMLSGLSQSLHPLHWDAKPPLNVNDADIFPGSTDKVQSREGPTEMAYVLMLFEMYKFKLAAESTNDGPALEAALLGQDLSQERDGGASVREDAIAKFRENARELNRKMEELENRLVDVNAGNVHKAALTVRPMLTGRLVELLIPLNEQPEYGTEIFGPRDNLFKIFVVGSEQRLGQYEIMKQCGFLWFVRSFFQPDVYALISGHLCERPTGSLADRGWAVMEKICEYHEELFDMAHRQYVVQAQITLKAWKAREQSFLQAGMPLETPEFIHKLRELAPSQDSKSSGQSHSSNTPPMPNQADPQQHAAMMLRRNQMMAQQQRFQQQQMSQHMHPPPPIQASQAGGMDPFLGGLFDVSNINWDVFGDMGNPNEQGASNMFGYPFSSGGFGDASGAGGANNSGHF